MGHFVRGDWTSNGLLDAKSRAGVWVNDAHPLNRAVRVPGPYQSNQVGELAVVLIALQNAPRKVDLTIISDSQYVIQALNHSLRTWEDTGWTDTQNDEWLRATAYHLQNRSAPTCFKWVKGHNGMRGNEEADKPAATGVNKPASDSTDL